MNTGPMLRCHEVGAQMRRGRTAIYEDVKAGVLTAQVKIGARAVAWPRLEVEAVLSARIAGQPESEIKALVKRLMAARTRLLATIGPVAAAVAVAVDAGASAPRPR